MAVRRRHRPPVTACGRKGPSRWPASSITLAFDLALVLAGVSLIAPPADAHVGDATAYAAITVSGRVVRYSLTLTGIPTGPLAERLRPPASGAPADYAPVADAIAQHIQLTSDAGPCRAGRSLVTPPSASVFNLTVVVDFACPEPVRTLEIVDNLFGVMGDDLHTLARIETRHGTQQFVFATENREARIVIDDTPPPTRGAGSLLVLGLEQFITGYDHLLFILALMICGGTLRQLLLIAIAFTIAHSITLALAVTGLVTLPVRLIQSLLALSIAYVAAENLMPRLAVFRRWIVSFAFGLVHGFGFAEVLRVMELPAANLPVSLLSFNVGIELGQAAVLLCAFPLARWLSRQPSDAPAVTAISGVILVAGLGLFLERTLL